jgi:hypothetical protein
MTMPESSVSLCPLSRKRLDDSRWLSAFAESHRPYSEIYASGMAWINSFVGLLAIEER